MAHICARNVLCVITALGVGFSSLFPSHPAYAQQPPPPGDQAFAVRVFLDISSRYEEYIKQQIPFVNYVRDRLQADVHVMYTYESTGSSGRQYTITFAGLKSFDSQDDTLMVMTNQMDSEEMIRQKLAETIKLGLIQYVRHSPQATNIRISYAGGIRAPERVVDKWNYWVFNISNTTRLSGSETSDTTYLRGSISADRVTPDWNISMAVGMTYNDYDYHSEYRKSRSISRTHYFDSLIVKSISDHWSIGGFADWDKSMFSNLENSFSVAPAIEYNVFPYAESTFHELRFLYRTLFTDVDYIERTIYLKNSERLVSESLEATYEIKEQWGSITTSLEGSHYFHDFEKNRVELSCNVSIRLLEGLLLTVYGSASQINDQLSISAGGMSLEDILLDQKEQSTSYDYSVSIGLTYAFGSIYSNVVNPRFGQ